VVGSGPGGGPLASRLAIAGYKVLLIDAGDDEGESPIQQVPALHPFASEYVPQTWEIFVRHYADEERQARNSKTVYELPSGERYVGLDPPAGATQLGLLYPRAGTLGGCSSQCSMFKSKDYRLTGG
jgi:choline dehydrogenase